MKRGLIWGVGIVLVLAGGWSAVWMTGRDEVAQRFEIERDRLAARGIEVTHEPPAIGGFPLAYRVEFDEVAIAGPAGVPRLDLPGLVAEAEVGAPDRITWRFPERFALTLPADAPAPDAMGADSTGDDAAGDDARPAAPAVFDIEADRLVVTQVFAEGAPARVEIEAASLLAVSADPATQAGAALELRGVSGSHVPAGPGRGAEASLSLGVEALDSLVTRPTAAGGTSRFEALVEGIDATLRTDQRDLAALAALLAGAPGGGRLSATLQTGTVEIAGDVEGETPAGSGSVALASGTLGLVLEIAAGSVEMTAGAENNRVTLSAGNPELPLDGELGIDRIETVYRAPMLPKEEMETIALRAALGMIRGDEAFWQGLDPEGVLKREPGEIVLDLEGTARLLAGEDGAAGPRAELGTLDVRHADVAALGARLATEGEIAFLQPANLPQGTLTVTLARSMELIGELLRAGLVSIPTARLLTDLAANFTRAGETPGTLVTDVTIEGTEVRVNGAPLLGLERALP